MSSSAPHSSPSVKGKLFAGLDDAALREIYYAAQLRRIGARKKLSPSRVTNRTIYSYFNRDAPELSP